MESTSVICRQVRLLDGARFVRHDSVSMSATLLRFGVSSLVLREWWATASPTLRILRTAADALMQTWPLAVPWISTNVLPRCAAAHLRQPLCNL